MAPRTVMPRIDRWYLHSASAIKRTLPSFSVFGSSRVTIGPEMETKDDGMVKRRRRRGSVMVTGKGWLERRWEVMIYIMYGLRGSWLSDRHTLNNCLSFFSFCNFYVLKSALQYQGW